MTDVQGVISNFILDVSLSSQKHSCSDVGYSDFAIVGEQELSLIYSANITFPDDRFIVMQNRAKPLDPASWQEMLQMAVGSTIANAETSQLPLVMDVRNGYEWDGGHFTGAARPLEVQHELF